MPKIHKILCRTTLFVPVGGLKILCRFGWKHITRGKYRAKECLTLALNTFLIVLDFIIVHVCVQIVYKHNQNVIKNYINNSDII